MSTMPVVSMITPCYNGGKFVSDFLESLLHQTYTNIEFIFVNDGSTDETEQIVKSYANRLADAGIQLLYLYQENQGLGAAINAGLKRFTGDYLCWPDSDDTLSPCSVEKRLNFLETHREYAVVSSDATIVYDEAEKPITTAAAAFPLSAEPNQFQLLLTEQSLFCSGCHMIRTSAFLDANPNRFIFPARRGQNWQMLLPVYYKYRRFFMDEPLYHYRVHQQSMSSEDDTEEKCLFRFQEHETILMETLQSIDMPCAERETYERLVAERYSRKRFYCAIDYRNKRLLNIEFRTLKKRGVSHFGDWCLYVRAKYPIAKLFFKIKEKLVT